MQAQEMVLVVDLDGSLIRSDMLFETFWAAFAADWRTPMLAAGALLRGGRAGLKRRLAGLAAPRPEDLPYAAAVLDHIRQWRAQGGRVVLATASDAALAEAVAGHLGLFDAVAGSDGTRNLKGQAKADYLTERFGPGGFVYLGDSRADLPVWAQAAGAVTVGAAPALVAEVERLGIPTRHLAVPEVRRLWVALEAMRPHQWLKNVLVFVPMLVDHTLTPEAAARSLLAFLAFGLVASSVYVLNDMLDLAADRAHPRKRARPFASGRLPLATGTAMAPGLLALGLAAGAGLGWDFLAVMLIYFALTMVYSLKLKRLVIVDICVLAALYTLRIVAGGAATGIGLSVWLVAFSMFFFLSLAAVKRLGELVDAANRGQEIAAGRGYEAADRAPVGQMAMSAGHVAVLVMALYITSPEVQAQYGQPHLLWGVCAVLLYWVSRMVTMASRGRMHDDPVVYATRDPISRGCGLAVLAILLAAALL